MKKTNLFMMLLAGMLLLSAVPAMSAQTTENVPELDGTLWMQSTSDEKRAFLYGAGSAIAVEYNVRTRHDEQPSRFVQGWVDAFNDKTWPQLEREIDQYYINNPTRMNEHVLHVMWNNMIKPNLKD